MNSKLIRIEQKEADMVEVDRILNTEIKKLESAGHTVKDARLAVGRDADKESGIALRYSVSVILLYD